MRQFDFGQNWADYSAFAITPQRVSQARQAFQQLLEGIDLRDRTFLDIGFGQGFALLSAAAEGAWPLGCDTNPKCGEVLARNKSLFPELAGRQLDAVIGSILDPELVHALREHARRRGADGFDVVHSWGVLHHTGNMRLALANSASLVRRGGYLVIAIYNRHWSSLPWLWIKRFYCSAPGWLQRAMVSALYPVIWLAKLFVTGRNPGNKERGMDFFYDVVDWVGGYPYEYADIAQVEAICHKLGFSLIRARPAAVPTGCNEFVFQCVRTR
jgi:2-polyprenyl-6-hydroxyphenyl methylase/3-demethylubiquinone-9 3-methyltransferase